MAVHDLEPPKAINTKCQHLTKKCSIYEKRPASCRTFDCAYLTGDIPSRFKPEKTNAVVWQTMVYGTEGFDMPTICISVKKGKKIPKNLLSYLLEKTRNTDVPVVVERHYECKIYQYGKVLGHWNSSKEHLTFDLENKRIKEFKSGPKAKELVELEKKMDSIKIPLELLEEE